MPFRPFPTRRVRYASVPTAAPSTVYDVDLVRNCAIGNTDEVIDVIQDAAETGYVAVHSFWSDFRAFLQQGSAVELGFGIIIGSVFSKLMDSIIQDVLLPPISLLVGKNLANQFLVLKQGKTVNQTYFTLEEAQNDGAITENWGSFLQTLVTFLLVSLALYWSITVFSKFLRTVEENVNLPQVRVRLELGNCPVCLEEVKLAAKRCPHCTSEMTPVLMKRPQLVTVCDDGLGGA